MLHWTAAEKEALLAAVILHGRDWAALAAAVPSRSVKQIKTWWQNNRSRLHLEGRVPREDRLGLREAAEEQRRRKGIRKAQESVAAAVLAAQQAAQQSGPQLLGLPPSSHPTLLPTAGPGSSSGLFQPSPLSSQLAGALSLPSGAMGGSPLLLLPSSALSPTSLPLSTLAGLPATAAALSSLTASAAATVPSAPFAFVAVPPSSLLSPANASSTSTSPLVSASSATQPLMLMIPPSALSPAVSPLHLNASSASFHAPSTAPLLLSPSDHSTLSIAPPSSDAEVAAGVMAASSALLPSAATDASTSLLVDLPSTEAQLSVTPMSSAPSPSSVYHVTAAPPRSPSAALRLSPVYSHPFALTRGGAASAGTATALASTHPPLVPFTSISQDVTDALLSSSSASTPVGSSLASPVRLTASGLPPQSAVGGSPLADVERPPVSFSSPALLSLDRERDRMLSPSPSPSVSSMKGAPPSPPLAAADDEGEVERPVSPPISPTSAQRTMSTFSPLSHLAHHPYSSSPPSPASEKSSPVSSSPPSPTPSILSLHTLSSPSMLQQQPQPRRSRQRGPASSASSPHHTVPSSSSPSLSSHPSRSILSGFGEREKRPGEREEKRPLGLEAVTDPAPPLWPSAEEPARGIGASEGAAALQPSAPLPPSLLDSAGLPLKAVLASSADAEWKEESELGESDELRDDASMMTALSALPEPPSPKLQPRPSMGGREGRQPSVEAVSDVPFAQRPPASPSSTTNLDTASDASDEGDAADAQRDDGGAMADAEAGAAAAAGPLSISPSMSLSTASSAFLSPPLTSSAQSQAVEAPVDAPPLRPLRLSTASEGEGEMDEGEGPLPRGAAAVGRRRGGDGAFADSGPTSLPPSTFATSSPDATNEAGAQVGSSAVSMDSSAP